MGMHMSSSITSVTFIAKHINILTYNDDVAMLLQETKRNYYKERKNAIMRWE